MSGARPLNNLHTDADTLPASCVLEQLQVQHLGQRHSDTVSEFTGLMKNQAVTGIPGPKGDKGLPGHTLPGVTGERGLPGEKGSRGDKGAAGSKGERWLESQEILEKTCCSVTFAVGVVLWIGNKANE
ncbi:hypothetical protein INR49_008396 [Caranx melampygus]|nr:hypothetical protein INR49_008396 [Caranx melampygus]